MRYLVSLILLLATTLCSGQIDTEFWFAAPDLTKGKIGEPRRDSTIYLVFSSFDQASTIIVNQPANPDFDLIVVELAANSSESINLGEFLSLIESKPVNENLNTGLLIRATKPITAYYEVRGSNNSDIFALKGKNALGTKFYTPFQNEYNNSQSWGGSPYIPPPRAGFVVMATKNNTNIQITPSADLLGHPAGVPFSVQLDRGQTYACEALGFLGAEHPGGSIIESDKAITVTIKDDMVDFDSSNDSGADVLGDQMISYNFLGKDHILVKGELSENKDRVVVCATEDNTTVDLNGGQEIITLNEGEQHLFAFTDDASFISASAKIAVFHVSGRGDQTAGAMIPSLDCTGSRQVGFVRGNNRPFTLSLTIRAGSEDMFELNGNPNLITASDFSPVPGSAGEYVFARLDFSTAEIPVGTANLLTNFGDELFHLGTTNGNGTSSCNYGYFSAFSFLNIGKNREVCLGDTITLDAGPGKTGYFWNTGAQTQTIEVWEAGTYYVEAFSGSDCVATDTITVTNYLPPVDLGPNDTICTGTSTTLSVDGIYYFEWQDGSTENFYTTADSGIFWVDVSDFQGCTFRDSIHIALSERPETPEIFGDELYCEGEDIVLTMGEFDEAQYRYILPDGSEDSGQILVISNVDQSFSGMYQGYYIVEGCESFADTLDIEVLENPQVDLGEDISVCEDEPVILDPGLSEGEFEWQDGSNEQVFIPTSSGTHFLTVTNILNSCSSSDTVEVEFRPLPLNPVIAGQSEYCVGTDLELFTDPQSNASFEWIEPGGTASMGDEVFNLDNIQNANAGIYQVLVELAACYSDTAEYQVIVHNNPDFDLGADTTICNNNQIILVGPPDMVSYLWSTGEETELITAGAGSYDLSVEDANGCVADDAIEIDMHGPIADFDILPDTITKPGDLLSFQDMSQADGGEINIWNWNFGTGDISSQQNPVYAYGGSGVFNVQLTVIDENNCSDQTSQYVHCNFGLRVPEGFSPNGDGINDRFEILGIEGVNDVQVEIFNRWGSVVFESSNYHSGNFWDGDDLPDGTYFYIISIPGIEAFSGPITISR